MKLNGSAGDAGGGANQIVSRSLLQSINMVTVEDRRFWTPALWWPNETGGSYWAGNGFVYDRIDAEYPNCTRPSLSSSGSKRTQQEMQPLESVNTSFAASQSHVLAESLNHASVKDTGSYVSAYLRWKRWLSPCVAAMLLVPALPVIVLLAALVRLTSRGPGLYRQVRVGAMGKSFLLYKIRTMRCDAEAATGPVWTAPNDPRVTAIGRFLRRVHLDELPQLFNVLRGEMMLVGPRPERPEFTQYLAREIPGYMDRYLVPPGITGLAQINLPPDTDVTNVRRKLVLDLEYVQAASLWVDLRILLCTALRLFGLPGLGIARFLGLVRTPEISERMMRQPASDHGVPAPYRIMVAHIDHTANDKAAKRKKVIPTG